MTSFPRRPAGYRGVKHETLGSDIRAVVDSLILPEAVLGEELLEQTRALDPNGWYPIQRLLDLTELLDERLGAGGLIKTGKRIFENSHKAQFHERIKTFTDLIGAFDSMYRHANRGEDIGGWETLSFDGKTAVLRNTTPHHCKVEEGIWIAIMAALKVPTLITQTECFREGAEACIFKVETFGAAPSP